jgi:hypothetical protein
LGERPKLPTFNEDDGRNAWVASKYEKRMDSLFWEQAVVQVQTECPGHSVISDVYGIKSSAESRHCLKNDPRCSSVESSWIEEKRSNCMVDGMQKDAFLVVYSFV